jgi:DNA-binding Xre family transcriptional regulator
MPSGKRDEPTNFTKFIASYLTEKKTMPTAELARMTEISRAQLVKMLQGGKYWDIDQLEAVCHALNEDIVDVISRAEQHVHASNVTPLRKTVPLDKGTIDLDGYEKAADHHNDEGEPEIP